MSDKELSSYYYTGLCWSNGYKVRRMLHMRHHLKLVRDIMRKCDSFVGVIFLVFLSAVGFTAVQSTLFVPGMRLDADTLPDLTDTCLGCICEATTNCNLTIGCMRGLCGPFLISHAYWVDAGRPVMLHDKPDRPGAYQTCVNDPYCAAETVRQYIARFAQDCNKDRKLDCDDYARMHYLGGFQCSLPIDRYMYYHVFTECRRSLKHLNG